MLNLKKIHSNEIIENHLQILFVETDAGAVVLKDFLSRSHYPVTSIQNNHSQQEQENALTIFLSGQKQIHLGDVIRNGLLKTSSSPYNISDKQVPVTGRKVTRMIKVTRRILQRVNKKGEIFHWRRRKSFF